MMQSDMARRTSEARSSQARSLSRSTSCGLFPLFCDAASCVSSDCRRSTVSACATRASNVSPYCTNDLGEKKKLVRSIGKPQRHKERTKLEKNMRKIAQIFLIVLFAVFANA